MNRVARSLAALTLCAAVFLGSAGRANAWYKVRNNTPSTIWVAHAFASTIGLGCGWDDFCDDRTLNGWRVEGWWAIAPGATTTIHSKGFGNAVHQLFGNDFVGHVWGNSGGWFGTPNAAFSRCEPSFTDDQPYYHYAKIRDSWCCGGSCVGDYITTLNI
jgi:uncharacterized membrane protein